MNSYEKNRQTVDDHVHQFITKSEIHFFDLLVQFFFLIKLKYPTNQRFVIGRNELRKKINSQTNLIMVALIDRRNKKNDKL